jgi:hypothetical protein
VTVSFVTTGVLTVRPLPVAASIGGGEPLPLAAPALIAPLPVPDPGANAKVVAAPVGDRNEPGALDLPVSGTEVDSVRAAELAPKPYQEPAVPPSAGKRVVPPGFVKAQSKQVGGSAKELVFANPDGSVTIQEFSRPALVKDKATGLWGDFDGSAVSDGKGRLVPAAGGVGVSVAASSGGSVLAEVHDDQGHGVGFSMAGIGDVPAVVQGRKVTFAEVSPGVDVNEYMLISGVKEEVVLKTRPASAPVFRFPLTATGVTPRNTVDGVIELLDSKDLVVGSIPQGLAWDSNPHMSEEQRSVPVATVLTGGPGTWAIELRPDAVWLMDPATVYPVVVDPSITFSPDAAGDAYIVNNIPDGNFNGAAQWSTSLGFYIDQAGWSKPGPSDSWNTYFSYFQFATPWRSDCEVTAAKLVVDPAYQRRFSETGTVTHISPLLYDVYQVNSAWAPSTVTWATAPAAGYLSSANGDGTGLWSKFDVSSTVVGWVNGTVVNYGLALGVNDGVGGDHAAIVSLEQGAFQPHLEVTCRPKAVPLSPADGWVGHVVTGNSVTFQWTDEAYTAGLGLSLYLLGEPADGWPVVGCTGDTATAEPAAVLAGSTL